MAEPRFDVTTLGETMLRISVAPGTPLEAANVANLHAAGAESNVAAALASLGRRVGWCSRLPDNPPARLIAGTLRRAGVDLSLVEWCDTGRLGTFYVELEPPPTPVRVTYDRADSCAAQMTPDSIDWATLLDTRLLHLTGITPALSTSCLATTREAVRRAKAAGVPISFDVNYRSKLWSTENARTALLPLVRDIDLLLIGEADAQTVFGLTGSPEQKLAALAEQTKAKRIVLTIGSEGVIARDGETILREPAQPTTVIDRLGAGDAMAAGIIHGWLTGDFAMGLRAGAALAALALRRHGDVVTCSPATLSDLLTGSTGRPVR